MDNIGKFHGDRIFTWWKWIAEILRINREKEFRYKVLNIILKEVIIVNEFNEFECEIFSAAGDIAIRSMMGGVYIF